MPPQNSRPKLNLTSNRDSRKNTHTEPKVTFDVKSKNIDLTASREDDEEDKELIEEISAKSKSGNQKFIVLGAGAICVVVVLFLILIPGNKSTIGDPTPIPTPTTADTQASTDLPLGTQDFTKNTTMTNSDVLTNPDNYTKDLYGLTTRVDFTVKEIREVADFVSYIKHRGTFGNGIELYWLEAEYKKRPCVVQIPFKYYKELDDEGIVPVKMEVLVIPGNESDGDFLIISYMELDEETLKNLLKSQSKK